ncbi:hypothetical protein NLJ89_g11532 [Agrocybe chaxingu]|uniref:DUF6533 domain-containing protein n=1 Tax=Agrocybe chaxingu TaxID=84603 RepID=A0A9W8MPA4_9AGAR|nr:hypothetical protein NLJ89_g11532 [Agrocybe chaxingu]
MDRPDGVAALVELLRDAQVLEMVDVAAITMFVWDYLITFGMEVEYMWCGKWNFITAVYLVQRYLPFIDTVWMMPHVSYPPIPHWRGCFATMASFNIVVVWILLLVWDLLILMLMVIPALKAYHYRGHSALYSTVYAEGIIYYFYLFVLNIVLLRLNSIDTVYRFMFVSPDRCAAATGRWYAEAPPGNEALNE